MIVTLTRKILWPIRSEYGRQLCIDRGWALASEFAAIDGGIVPESPVVPKKGRPIKWDNEAARKAAYRARKK